MDITSRANPKIKYIRSLHQKKGRKREGLMLVEGTKLVREAFNSGFELHSLYFTPASENHGLPQNIPAYCVSEDVMALASTLKSPPDILALVVPQSKALNWDADGFIFVTAGVQDPGNFGALLRLAWAMNLTGIMTWGEHVDIWSPKVIRGSMGGVFHVPVQTLNQALLNDMKTKDWTVIGTSLQGSQQSFSYAFPSKTCVMLGSEGQGLAPDVLALADQTLRIPMRAGVDSLNVTLTAAMLAYAFCQQYAGGLNLG